MTELTESINRRQCLEEQKKNKAPMIKRAVEIINQMIDLRSKDIAGCLYTVEEEEIRKEIINGIVGKNG